MTSEFLQTCDLIPRKIKHLELRQLNWSHLRDFISREIKFLEVLELIINREAGDVLDLVTGGIKV